MHGEFYTQDVPEYCPNIKLLRHCPRCKQLRRSSKTLSIARLPPVLLIHFKRFMARRGGLFYDKSETPVIFPATRESPLDLTRWMPQDATGGGHPGDPMQMNGPYKYELFALSNHQGNLSNGHCEFRDLESAH